MRCFILLFSIGYALSTHAVEVVNVYVWGGEIPQSVVQAFEKSTNIHVNFSTYDSNEMLYAKLKAGGLGVYDVILPSAYFAQRMIQQNMLHPLDHRLLPNDKNLASSFTNLTYDKHNRYSIPMTWGITGMFYPSKSKSPPTRWRDFWQPKWRKQLVLLDDTREVFSMALFSLGYDSNDENPDHIHQAYQALLKLKPNIKLFASDNIQSIVIDEDASAGMLWNGDANKVLAEKAPIDYQFPKDGYIMWIDSVAIPKRAPHIKAAHTFINFLLKASSAKSIAIEEGHAITNQAGIQLLPDNVRNNPITYPDKKIIDKATIQRDISAKSLALYSRYWQQFKLSF